MSDTCVKLCHFKYNKNRQRAQTTNLSKHSRLLFHFLSSFFIFKHFDRKCTAALFHAAFFFSCYVNYSWLFYVHRITIFCVCMFIEKVEQFISLNGLKMALWYMRFIVAFATLVLHVLFGSLFILSMGCLANPEL